ncbi:hypothetical protein CEB3_c31880 [Peptococcaceae bacterium CEB3]|nr:hypothetical protein CEB3_c31880 [Peptococcaceae bacterium CEB3]
MTDRSVHKIGGEGKKVGKAESGDDEEGAG